MTTLTGQSGVEEILHRLSAVQSRRWTLRVFAALLAVLTLAAGVAFLTAVALGYWPADPPEWLTWTMRVICVAAVTVGLSWFLLRSLLWRQTAAQAARFVETHLPDAGNDLINPVLLANDNLQSSSELVQRAIRESADKVARLDLNLAISATSPKRWGIAATGAIALLLVLAILQPHPFGNAMASLVGSPRTNDAPSAGAVDDYSEQLTLVRIAPADGTFIYADKPVNVLAEIRSRNVARIGARAEQDGQAGLNAALAGLNARIEVEGEATPLPMQAEATDLRAGRVAFAGLLPVPPGDKSALRLAVRIDSHRWPANGYFTLPIVRVEQAELTLTPPSYTKPKSPAKPVSWLAAPSEPFESPQGSRVEVRVKFSRPVSQAVMHVNDSAPAAMTRASDGATFTGQWVLMKDSRLAVVVKDGTSDQLRCPAGENAACDIRCIADKPPVVKLITPDRDAAVSPGGTLHTQVRIADDYELTGANFLAWRESSETAPSQTDEPHPSVHSYPVAGQAQGQWDFEFKLPAEFVQGDVIIYQITATDNRNIPGVGGPQTGASGKFKIFVQNSDALSAEKARRYEQLRKRLMEILRLQEQQRVATETVRTMPGAAKAVADAGAMIANSQEAIKAALRDLATTFTFDAEMTVVKQAVSELVVRDAQLAIDQAKVLAALRDLTSRGESCGVLGATQDRILNTLRTLLAILPSLTSQKQAADIAGADLPAAAREKLSQLKKDIDAYQEAQKKLIEAAQRLAKKPVDDFTADDKKVLEALQVAQDKWEKFLNEAITDFSKLAEQDFSNPAMLQELISVKSDVTMARDALAQKAIEVATAFEDNGIENAKELTANIEKWLMDTPDRKKWAMEDPVGGQENIEQAELPTELEDLVGDLLEDEEDLFEEADDVTSKYTMSGDKGIGWDAGDGPIANMNAQGVTGNQLPNTNEMGGRGGEGRQGKSSGEMVQDEFVGKGGRRTPTRLTGDPFQQGQVKDKSTESPGGATGGGKLAGAGQEGLEGPAPAPLAKEMQRLAGKQATLLNKAERLAPRFQPGDYAGFKFLQAITLMNQVKGDLEHNRYQNVLRTSTEALGTLRQSRMLLAGEVDVIGDPSQAMPKYVRDDMLDAMRGRLPEEFRAALQEYYRRLAQTAGQ